MSYDITMPWQIACDRSRILPTTVMHLKNFGLRETKALNEKYNTILGELILCFNLTVLPGAQILG